MQVVDRQYKQNLIIGSGLTVQEGYENATDEWTEWGHVRVASLVLTFINLLLSLGGCATGSDRYA